MASGTTKAQSQPSVSAGQAALDRFTQMMIDRMEQMKASDWKKEWIERTAGIAGLPQNIVGRNYSGSNSLFLMMHTMQYGYELPVYLTFNQAHNLKAHVLKGEKAFPVVYWDRIIKDKEGHKVSEADFRNLTKEEKKDLLVIHFVKSFPVYNIDQTNLRTVQPEKVQKLIDKFKAPELRDTNGMFKHPGIDELVRQQEWVCPILADKPQRGAYYSPAKDIVVVPMKAQFNIGETKEEVYIGGQAYYSTMLHEMAHSTITPERLNREMGGRFGDRKYAKEELVAELTAAMISHSMGFDSKITDNSAAYLDSWITTLKKEPKFIISVMADVNKASELILDYVDKMQLKLGEKPYLAKNDPHISLDNTEDSSIKNAAIIKTKNGGFAIKASIEGDNMLIKPIEKSTAKTYFQLTDMKEKKDYLMMTTRKHFSSEIEALSQKKEEPRKIKI